MEKKILLRLQVLLRLVLQVDFASFSTFSELLIAHKTDKELKQMARIP